MLLTCQRQKESEETVAKVSICGRGGEVLSGDNNEESLDCFLTP